MRAFFSILLVITVNVSALALAQSKLDRAGAREAFLASVVESYNESLETQRWLRANKNRWTKADSEFMERYLRDNKIERFLKIKQVAPLRFEFLEGAEKRGELRILEDDTIELNGYKLALGTHRSLQEATEYIDRVLRWKRSSSNLYETLVPHANAAPAQVLVPSLTPSLLFFHESTDRWYRPSWIPEKWWSQDRKDSETLLRMAHTHDVAAMSYQCNSNLDTDLPPAIRSHYDPAKSKSIEVVRTLKLRRVQTNASGRIESSRMEDVRVVVAAKNSPKGATSDSLEVDVWVDGELKTTAPAGQFLDRSKSEWQKNRDQVGKSRKPGGPLEAPVVAYALMRCCGPAETPQGLTKTSDTHCFQRAYKGLQRSGIGDAIAPVESSNAGDRANGVSQ